ncbi:MULTISPECIES: EAL and HDOD domain-containing protein [unclassified Sedimentibacter]|uniref:EAL and HDOD domain-containing protein n=1 Tax=unclassified Sedimentibacter TaxID=2649220 RepID=UPI0027E080D6|nr:HDOD domain-containing protein [Sedimentibacter sp. MB35-C1]WMJ77151.1 HDOD domain-containing protein [Sedimentibacter sp. MB35-C1]
MDVYVARQPIFDRNMNVFGYELLYRRSMNNYYEGTDDNQATAELINNAFLTMHFRELTGGTNAFINFSQDMLIKEIPLLLPSDSTVVEVLERVEINEDVIEACKKLKENGYIIALDDFVFSESYLPLLDIAHIVKIEFPAVNLEEQHQLIKKYGNKIKFLAEKVETREEYQLALKMGYDYFQGYFFSKPVIIKGKEIDSLSINLMKILEEINKPEPEYKKIADIIETDLGLSYKLLKLANSVFFGSRNKILYTRQALVQLGLSEIRKWIYVMVLKDIQHVENKELIKTCFIRAKLMEHLAAETGRADRHFEYFTAGMLSSIDVLLNKDMNEIVEELVLSDDVKDALLGNDNEIKMMMDVVTTHELIEPKVLTVNEEDIGISRERFMSIYLETLMWVLKLDY